jgi:hypothetical protein
MLTRSLKVAASSTVLLLAALCVGSPVRARADLPLSLTDEEFWQLTEDLSEPSGYFRSDNFLSNESGYQDVIPELVDRLRPGGVYLGVAPEINFTYVAAVKPQMAFIIDIRRGNLHEHLLYKALFEMSADRAEFLSRLFSRQRPEGLTRDSSVFDLFHAYTAVPASEALFQENLQSVLDWLTATPHALPLWEQDPEGIAYVYREGFFRGGPYLDYSYGSRNGMGGRNTPTYEQLMLATDGYGRNHSFLADEDTFQWVRRLQMKNLLVPVVGNFGGEKAIRAVGQFVRERGGTVGAFYLSNVEQYLYGDLWDSFCANVATLPLDETSTYIYSGRGAPNLFGRGYGRRSGGMGLSRLRLIAPEVQSCMQ